MSHIKKGARVRVANRSRALMHLDGSEGTVIELDSGIAVVLFDEHARPIVVPAMVLESTVHGVTDGATALGVTCEVRCHDSVRLGPQAPTALAHLSDQVGQVTRVERGLCQVDFDMAQELVVPSTVLRVTGISLQHWELGPRARAEVDRDPIGIALRPACSDLDPVAVEKAVAGSISLSVREKVVVFKALSGPRHILLQLMATFEEESEKFRNLVTHEPDGLRHLPTIRGLERDFYAQWLDVRAALRP